MLIEEEGSEDQAAHRMGSMKIEEEPGVGGNSEESSRKDL